MIKKIFILSLFLLAVLPLFSQIRAYRYSFSNPAFHYRNLPKVKVVPDTVDYFLLWGQSNAISRAQAVNIPAQYAYLADTIQASTVSFNGYPIEKIIAGGGSNPYQDTGDFGPDVAFADTLSKVTNDTVYILKFAIGSTTLASRPANDWNVNNTGELYDSLKHKIRVFEQTLLSRGKAGRCVVVLGMQGEDDATVLADAQAYGSNLEGFIDSLRGFYNNPVLPFVFGEINGINDPLMVYRDTTRNRQYNVIRYEYEGGTTTDTPFTRDHTYLIDTDLYTFNDLVHYDAPSTVQFGWQMYAVLRQNGILP